MDTRDKKLTSIRLNKNLYEHLQKKAKAENRSLNNYIETLLWDSSEFRAANAETLEAMQEAKEHLEGKKKMDGMKDDESVKEYLLRIMKE